MLGVGFIFDGLAIFDGSLYYQPKSIDVLELKFENKKVFLWSFFKSNEGFKVANLAALWKLTRNIFRAFNA